MSVGVVLGRDGSVTKPTVTPSRVRVTHKLTYEAADALLASAAAAAAEEAEAAAGEAADPAAVDVLVRLREAADLRWGRLGVGLGILWCGGIGDWGRASASALAAIP